MGMPEWGHMPVARLNLCWCRKPSKIVSHHIEIDDAPEAYDKFDKRIEGHAKILIQFGEHSKAA
jgi:threonine dehydrogenase-like Zn-dependent dehydrogenase